METPRLPLSLTPPTPELETLVELLVDDELDAVERRALLERLDAVEGGWKYCATAFLEAQTFRKAFRFLAVSESADVPCDADGRPNDFLERALLSQSERVRAPFDRPSAAPVAASRRDFPEPRSFRRDDRRLPPFGRVRRPPLSSNRADRAASGRRPLAS